MKSEKWHYQQILIAVFLLAVFLLALNKIHDWDAWIHLSMGKLLWELKGFPSTEPFVYTMEGKPFVYSSWLFSVISYSAYNFFNVYGVITLKALTVTAAFFILIRDSLRPYRNYSAAVVVMAAVVVIARHRFVERPDIFLMVFLTFSIFSLNAFIYDNKKYIYALPFTHMLWANSHSSINLMFIPFLAFIVGGFLQNLLAGRGFTFSNATSSKQIKIIMMIFGASFAASLISPYFISQYIFGVKAITTDWLKQAISEVRPPTWETNKTPFILASVVLLSFIVNWGMAYRSRSTIGSQQQKHSMPSLIYFLLVIPFMVLSFSAIRFIFLLAIVSGPIIARNISGFITMTMVGKQTEKRRISKMVAPVIVIILIVVSTSLSVSKVKPFADEKVSFGFGIDYNSFPEGALRYMDRRNITGRVYNLFQWGQYITWRDFPRRMPFIDGRAYILPELLRKITHAGRSETVLDELYQKYGFESILLNYPNLGSMSEAASSNTDIVVSHPGWVLVYWDDVSLLYLKRGSRYDSVIREDGYRVMKPANALYNPRVIIDRLHDKEYRAWITKELERNVSETGSSLGYMLLGYVYNETGRYREAIDALKKVRDTVFSGLLPMVYDDIASAYDKIGNIDESIHYLKKALSSGNNSAMIYYRTGSAFIKKGDTMSALKYLKKAVEVNRNLSSAYPALIGLYQELGMKDDALKASKIYEEVKSSAESEDNFSAGIKAYRSGDLKRAIENFKKSIEIIPSNPVTYSNIGYAYFDLGDMDMSFKYQKSAIDIDPNHANAYYGLALIYKKWGDLKTAKSYWEEFLRIEPAGYYSRKAKEEIDAIHDGS